MSRPAKAFAAGTGIGELSLEARVVRCTCSPAQRAESTWHGSHGMPCPQGQATDLGRIAYWHRNPLRRAAWRIGQWCRRLRPAAPSTESPERPHDHHRTPR